MGTGIELEAAEQYLRLKCLASTALAALVPGGFYSERVQTAPNGNYVIWSYQGSLPDVAEVHGVRILVQPLYLVRVIGATDDFTVLQPAAEALDAALHMAGPQALPGYTVAECARERPYSAVEHFVNIERRHLGGYYRLYIQPS